MIGLDTNILVRYIVRDDPNLVAPGKGKLPFYHVAIPASLMQQGFQLSPGQRLGTAIC